MKKECKLFSLLVLFTLLSILLVGCGKGKTNQTVPATEPTPTEEETYTATFTVNGRTVETQTVRRGETPISPYETESVVSEDEGHLYKLSAWNPPLSGLTSDMVFSAVLETEDKVPATVMWALIEGDPIRTETYIGATVTPPQMDLNFEDEIKKAVFTGWDREITTVEKAKTTYIAQYDVTYKTYDVTFKVDGETYAVINCTAGKKPSLPEKSPTKTGYSAFIWLDTDEPVKGEKTVTGAFTNFSQKEFSFLYQYDLIYYDKNDINDNRGNALSAGSALLNLLYTEHDAPQNGAVANRILAHIRNLIAGGNEPFFDSEPYWNYPIVTAALTLAKETPSVWSLLSEGERARVDCIMKAFTYITAYNTDDDNDFSTGPRLRGNYYKLSNPNYRLANVLPILFCSRYFGGANVIDQMLSGFNEEEYNRMIAAFTEYGFSRALSGWTTAGGTVPSTGAEYASAKELLLHGTTNLPAVQVYPTDLSKLWSSGGTGAGVPSGGSYTYLGHNSDDVAGILSALITYTYSGGYVTNGYEKEGKLVCYIMNNGSSPVLDYTGMMKEFNAGDTQGIRSNATYCDHDFVMLQAALETLSRMNLYSLTDHADEYALVWVGNTDAIYKMQQGYVGFSTGESHEYSELSDPAKIWIPVWNLKYGDLSILEALNVKKKPATVDGEFTVIVTKNAKEWVTVPDFTFNYHANYTETVSGARYFIDPELPNTYYVPELDSAWALLCGILSESKLMTVVFDDSWNGTYTKATTGKPTFSTSNTSDSGKGTVFVIGLNVSGKYKPLKVVLDTTGVSLQSSDTAFWFFAWKVDMKIVGNGKDNNELAIKTKGGFARLACGDGINFEMENVRLISEASTPVVSYNPVNMTVNSCYIQASGTTEFALYLERGLFLATDSSFINTTSGTALCLKYKNAKDTQNSALTNCTVSSNGGMALALRTTSGATKPISVTLDSCRFSGKLSAEFAGSKITVTFAGVNYLTEQPTDAAFTSDALGDKTVKPSTADPAYPYETGK